MTKSRFINKNFLSKEPRFIMKEAEFIQAKDLKNGTQQKMKSVRRKNSQNRNSGEQSDSKLKRSSRILYK